MAKTTQIAAKNVEFQLDPNPFTRVGYSFIGWNKDWRESEIEYEDGQSVTFDGDRDLYALWQINQYWVMFNANGGTGGWVEPRKMEYGAEVTAPEVMRTGHTFLEWQPPAPETVPPNDITCVAQWQVNQYRVTFDAAGGSGGWSQLQDYGSAIVPPEVTRTGYEFIEWQPTPAETVPDYDVEYVAQWELLTCVVNFDVCSDEATPVESKTINRGDALGELPTTSWPKPQGLAGVQFAGWWTEETGGVQVTPNTQVPMDKTQVTYYAHWEGVIHYQKVAKNTDQSVEIDSNGVASNFYGNSTESKYRALLSVADDQFDFSGNFTIVMKAKSAASVSYFRQDVFAGLDDGSSYNIFMDFGLYGRQTQWEIARYEPNHDLVVADTPLIQPDEVFTLKVVRTLEGNVSTVKCYVNNDSTPVLVGNQGNFAIGRFAIGIDGDSL